MPCSASAKRLTIFWNRRTSCWTIFPPEVLEDAADAIEYAIMGGEANGFCAGFYYTLRMMAGLEAGAARYYDPIHQQKEGVADGSI